MNKTAENVYTKNRNNSQKNGNQTINTTIVKKGNNRVETRPAPIPQPAPEFWKNPLSYQNKNESKN